MSQAGQIADQFWDIIIVGTGMGGSTLGHALAKSGLHVLFLDKGKSRLDHQALEGGYAESFFPPATKSSAETEKAILQCAGRYSDKIIDISSKRTRTFTPFIGAGSGGSTSLYGMALERFFPEDFEPGKSYLDIPGTSAPERWPISYKDLAPYYEAAERLYRVKGSPDPLRVSEVRDHFEAPPKLSPSGQEIFDFLERRGMHPYRLPLACDFAIDCNCCQGFICPHECKNDAYKICLKPAVVKHGAAFLGECNVIRLEADRSEVKEVVCTRKGEMFALRAKVVVLAAGALETPCILLRSSSNIWPNGLANRSGVVGRNLMRHHIDLYAISITSSTPVSRQKEIAFNDFYFSGNRKFGSVQSFGALPPGRILADSIQDDLSHTRFAWLAPAFGLLKPILGNVLDGIFEKKYLFASTLEDLPYQDNRVSPVSLNNNTSSISITYHLRDHDHFRINEMRRLLKSLFEPYRYSLIKQAENNQRIAHACGTCRFGDDPNTSALDKHNRAHGLSNLYVVDSSFFPSSSGTNPSLTIAANALRVAEHIISRSSSEI